MKLSMFTALFGVLTMTQSAQAVVLENESPVFDIDMSQYE